MAERRADGAAAPVAPAAAEFVAAGQQHRFGFAPLASAGPPEQGERVIREGWALLPVRFSFEAEPGSEVLLHLNGITDRHRTAVDGFLMEQLRPGLYQRIVLLPEALCASYRFAAAARIPRDAGSTREGWLEVHRLGVPDPHNPDRLVNPLGTHSSVLTLPAFPAHPAWAAAGEQPVEDASTDAAAAAEAGQRQTARAAEEHTVVVDGHPHRVWASTTGDTGQGPPARLLVLFDAEVWRTLPLERALLAAEHGGFAVLQVASEGPEARERLLTGPEGPVELLRTLLAGCPRWFGRGFTAAETIVAGQSYGGLAACTLLLAHPELVSAAVAQSGSYWVGEAASGIPGMRGSGSLGRIAGLAERGLTPGTRLMLQAGTQEQELLRLATLLHEQLQAGMGAILRFQVFSGGHDYAWWRHGLLHGLDALLRPEPSSAAAAGTGALRR